MTNVDKVVKAIENKDYVVLGKPKRAIITLGHISGSIDKEYTGHYVEFDSCNGLFNKIYRLFISDKEIKGTFHNGYSILVNKDLPNILWFQEPDDKIRIIGKFYI